MGSSLKNSAQSLGFRRPRDFFQALKVEPEYEITASINGQFIRVEYIDKFDEWEDLTVILIEKDDRVEALDRNELKDLNSIYEIIDEFDFSC